MEVDNLEINNILNSSEERNQYLTFALDEEEYAISILSVKEIIGMKKITKIPNLPAYIKGVINLRGNIIHIIDMRERFHMPEKEYDKFTVIIIVESNEKIMGVLVDQVKDVVNIDQDKIQPPLDVESSIESEYINGMARVEEKLIVTLDIEKLINRG